MGPIVNIVLPIFAIVLIGYVVGRRGLLGEASSEALNAFVYYVALPVLLFRSMARVDLEAVDFGAFLVVFIGAGALTFMGAFLVARWLFRVRGVNGMMFGVNATYGNIGYMGIPMAFAAFGEAGAVLTVIAAVSHALVWLPISIITLESARPMGHRPGGKFRAVFSGVISNPMLMSPLVGVLWSLSGLDLPVPVDAFCALLGAAAGPCALFSIGLFLVGKPVSEGMREVGVMVVFKLVVFPLVVAGLAFGVVGLAPLPAAVALLLAASPSGATCFVLAQNYGTFVQRSSSVILVSTAVAVVSVSVLFATPYLNVN